MRCFISAPDRRGDLEYLSLFNCCVDADRRRRKSAAEAGNKKNFSQLRACAMQIEPNKLSRVVRISDRKEETSSADV